MIDVRKFMVEIYENERSKGKPLQTVFMQLAGRFPTRSEIQEIVNKHKGMSAKVFEHKYVLIENNKLEE